MIYKAFKTELNPNNKQITLFLQHLGCARWAFNWALAKKIEAFKNKTKIPNNIDLHKELNKLKPIEIPWMYNSSKSSPQNALIDCDNAFNNFFRRCKQKVKGKKGFPKFKSKKNEKQSFRLMGTIHVKGNKVQLPRIGEVRLKEKDYFPENYKILSATILKKANKWFVSVAMEVPDKENILEPTKDVLGVDLGIKNLAVCSDGTFYNNPKALNKNLSKLKFQQKQLSRKEKGSNNQKKLINKVARIHLKISNIRKDVLHKITSELVQKANVIVIEDLDVSNLLKNKNLAKAISDVGFYEFRRQLEYKAKWNKRKIVVADRFFPSSKTDHKSGKVNKGLKLSDREICHEDGTKTDRDLNAAINLENFYRENYSQINASGDEGSKLRQRKKKQTKSIL